MAIRARTHSLSGPRLPYLSGRLSGWARSDGQSRSTHRESDQIRKSRLRPVPKLNGLTTSFAKRLLAAAHCKPGKVTKKATSRRSQVGKVMSQKTRAGSALALGTAVNVTVGKKKRR